MTISAKEASAASASSIPSILFAALLGAFFIFVAGIAQSETLHDAAHDVRHATGFPCH